MDDLTEAEILTLAKAAGVSIPPELVTEVAYNLSDKLCCVIQLPVPGEPAGGSIEARAALQGRMYAVHRTDDTQRLWYSNARALLNQWQGSPETSLTLLGGQVHLLAPQVAR